MDPISIMAGIGSLIISCGQITMAINTIVSNMKTVDETLSGFSDEVDGLGRVLSSIKLLSESKRGGPTNLTGHEGELWTNMSLSINDCGGTLSKLEQNLAKVYMPPNSRFAIPRKFVKMSFKADEINSHRVQLLQFKSTLQLSLQAISLSNDVTARASADAVMPALDELTSEIRKLAIKVNASPRKRETERLENCLRSAASVVSSASTIMADDRQTVAGSEFDGVFKPRQTETMDRWLRSNTVRQPAGSGRAHRLPGDGYDSDDDLNADVLEVYIAKARNSIPAQANVAERAARRAIQQMPPEPHTLSASSAERYFEAASLLGTALFLQDKFEEAEVLLAELQFRQEAFHERTHPGDRLGSPASLETQQRLAEIALKRRDPDKAELLARKTLRARTKVFGKDHPQRIETLQLLVSICRAKGEEEEADALMSLIPVEAGNAARPPSYRSQSSGSVHPYTGPATYPSPPGLNAYAPPLVGNAFSAAGFAPAASSTSPITRKPVSSPTTTPRQTAGVKMLLGVENAMRSGDKSGAFEQLKVALTKMLGSAQFDRWPEMQKCITEADSFKEVQGFTPLHFAAATDQPILARDLMDVQVNAEAEDADGSTPLMLAVRQNNVDVCAALLRKGANASCVDKSRTTPLHIAKDPSLLDMLISHGAEIDAKDNENRTPLHVAVGNDEPLLVKLLLERDASLELRDQDGHTPLSKAASKASLPITQMLVEHKANVNHAYGPNLMTPLHSAAEEGHVQLTKILLDGNADLNARDAQFQTPLYIATVKNQAGVVRHLLAAGADPNAAEKSKLRTPLHYAAENNMAAIAQQLVENGADLEAVDDTAATALYIAADKKHDAIVRFLLEKGANVEHTQKSHWRPLHRAARDGPTYEDVVRTLIEFGADVNAQTNELCTPLYHAVCGKAPKVVRLLLQQKASVDLAQENKWTPLAKACYDGSTEIINMLLDAGANIHAASESGCQPIYQTTQYPYGEAMEVMIRRGANINCIQTNKWAPIHYLCRYNHVRELKLLLKYKPDLTLRISNGETPLAQACSHGHLEVVKTLLEYGASLDEEDRTWNPLNCAANGGHVEVIKYLLKQGANVNALSPYLSNPLYNSVFSKKIETFNVLVAAGSDVQNKNSYGWTALSNACKMGLLDFVRRCLEVGVKLNHREARGFTALHALANEWGGSAEDSEQALKLLLKYGGDPMWKTKDGKTVIDIAKEKGKDNLVKILEGKA